MLCSVAVDESTHHWQLMEVQQLFDEASEHILTLPHFIQGSENKHQLHQERGETGERRGGKANKINILLM